MKLTSDSKIALKSSILSAVFTVVLLMVVSYFFNHTWNPFGNSTKSQPFTVQGTGTATATPDQAQINFSVTKTETKLQDAQNEANTFTNTMVADLQKLGISKNDIQTSNYNSSPNYANNETTVMPLEMIRQPQPQQQILNYTVSEDVTVTIRNASKANAVIDALTNDGAENISGPYLALSDKKQSELQDQARTNAIADAKQKAQSMAAAAGIHLGRITNIQEGNTGPFPVQPMMMKAAGVAQSNSVPTQINPGENTVTESVTLSYETW